MKTTMKAMAITLLALALGLGGTSRASFVVNVTESGGDVVAVGSGTLDTQDLIGPGNSVGNSFFGAQFGGVIFGGVGAGGFLADEFYSTIFGPSSYGPGSNFFATHATGDLVGIGGGDLLIVPQNYVSGSQLSSSSTWSGATFASLGLTPGTYTWTWGSGADADSFTMNIGGAAVPEPSSVVMLGLGALGLLGAVRRSRRTS